MKFDKSQENSPSRLSTPIILTPSKNGTSSIGISTLPRANSSKKLSPDLIRLSAQLTAATPEPLLDDKIADIYTEMLRLTSTKINEIKQKISMEGQKTAPLKQKLKDLQNDCHFSKETLKEMTKIKEKLENEENRINGDLKILDKELNDEKMNYEYKFREIETEKSQTEYMILKYQERCKIIVNELNELRSPERLEKIELGYKQDYENMQNSISELDTEILRLTQAKSAFYTKEENRSKYCSKIINDISLVIH